MSAIITEKFRQHNADQFVESFTETSASAGAGGEESLPPVVPLCMGFHVGCKKCNIK